MSSAAFDKEPKKFDLRIERAKFYLGSLESGIEEAHMSSEELKVT